jgi:hypothetical protein
MVKIFLLLFLTFTLSFSQDNDKIVVFLPVKGESSRIKNKNLKLLDGKPLLNL